MLSPSSISNLASQSLAQQVSDSKQKEFILSALGIYPRELKTYGHTQVCVCQHSQQALFPRAQKWRLKCPSNDKQNVARGYNAVLFIIQRFFLPGCLELSHRRE